jgi:hypothetical protein
MGLFIKVRTYEFKSVQGILRTDKDMDQDLRFGLMEQSMRVNGETIKLMERVNFGMQMEMFMKEIGKTIKLMALVCISMLMGPNMKEIGKMICKTDGELKVGQMEVNMKEVIKKE